MPRRAILNDLMPLRRVSREIVIRALGVDVRRFHDLIQRRILPQPISRGVYDLIAACDCYFLHKAGVPIPTTIREAARLESIGNIAMRVYLRRVGEDV